MVELNSTEEEQALALSIILHLVRSDSELLNQYRSDGGTSLILRVLESSRCHTGRHILKAMLDAACDSSIIIKDIGSGNHSISPNCEAVITDPGLIKGALTAWRAWMKYDTLNLLLQALLLLLRDQHSHREFNASQLNRVGIVDTILTLCKVNKTIYTLKRLHIIKLHQFIYFLVTSLIFCRNISCTKYMKKKVPY